MSAPDDREAFQKWAREVLQAMAAHLKQHDLVAKDEITVEARWNYPFRILIAQGHGKRKPEESFWLIGGDVPLDHLEGNAAKDAREVLRHFALRWQVQGARVRTAVDGALPPGQRSEMQVDWADIGDTFAKNAEFVYALAEDDRNWESTMRLGG